MESRFGSRRKTGSIRPILGAVLASFLLGALVVGYYFWKSGDADDPVSLAAPDSSPTAAITSGEVVPTPAPSDQPTEAAAAAVAAQAVERVAEQQGGLDQRLAAAEQRLARLDLQTQAAAGNAARAEGLLIAFAARRALERGEKLEYLNDQLRLRFGDNWPNAVRTIINFSDEPVRLDQLMARLEGLQPKLVEDKKSLTWAEIKRELSELFVIRRESTPSPQPEKRLERAKRALETGRIDVAIEEVRLLPGAVQATDWIADAERYRDAMEALNTIETAAVVDPGRLHDGSGRPIQQPSPADSATD